MNIWGASLRRNSAGRSPRSRPASLRPDARRRLGISWPSGFRVQRTAGARPPAPRFPARTAEEALAAWSSGSAGSPPLGPSETLPSLRGGPVRRRSRGRGGSGGGGDSAESDGLAEGHAWHRLAPRCKSPIYRFCWKWGRLAAAPRALGIWGAGLAIAHTFST